VQGTGGAAPAEVYQGFRAQRRELSRQLGELEDRREELAEQLQVPTLEGANKKGLEQRISDIDQRISALDAQLAIADANVAQAASVPGATVEPPSPPRTGPPEEVFVLGGMFIVVVLLPLTIAYARRIWRRGAVVVSAIPAELGERLLRLEQSMDSVAVEVERIGEGQRFMTKVLTEGGDSRALGAAAPMQRVHEPSVRP
jgi:hypothetical protein